MPASLTDARRQWLSTLYEANFAAVFKQCRRLLGSQEDAADAAQEVFLRAAASLTEAPDSEQARAWLNTVARNYCIDLLRRRERFGSALTTLGATADPPGEPVQTVENRQLLQSVLEKMGPRERQALWQSAVEDLPVGDIARLFGVSYLAAAQLLHRARRRALVLATRLTIILGLAQLARAGRRSNFVLRSQQIAAVVVVPLAIAAVVVSSSPHPAVTAQAKSPTHQAVAQNPAPPVVNPSLPVINPALPVASPPAAPIASPAMGAVLAAQVVAVKVTPVGVVVKPIAAPPAPIDRDKDHGKGRDRDDLAHKASGNGNAKGHTR